MSYMIICRTQRGALVGIQTGDDDVIAEFDTEEAARAAAENTVACLAGNYEIIEAPV